jgi:FKBP-type peptidyl-prolyl cis-trans isomerase 2
MYFKVKIDEKLNGRLINSYVTFTTLNDKLTKNEIKEAIRDKKEGEKVSLTIKNAYGEKNPDLIQIMPLSLLRKQGINPVPGLIIRVGEIEGIIKSISGGRVIVDFNHPLAGKDIDFEVEIIKKFDNSFDFAKELIESFIERKLIKKEDVEIKENKIIAKSEAVKDFLEEILNKVYNLNVEVELLKEEKREENEDKSNKDKKEDNSNDKNK